MDDDELKLRTVWCGNLSSRVTEELLYELFLQAGPIEDLSMPKDKNGSNRGYAFITYKHQCTVYYAIQLFEGTSLFDRKLRVTLRGGGSSNYCKKIEPILLSPFQNVNVEVVNMPPVGCNMQMEAPKHRPPAPLLQLPFSQMSPIPLAQACLKGQWSHSSPQMLPQAPKYHESNRRYQDRYQPNYYDRKRDSSHRHRR